MDNKSLSVSQLNKYISGLMEFDELLSNVKVKGEISNFKRHSSGHLYFSIKDDKSKISCVMFKSNAYRLDFEPIDGMSVIVSGRVSVYEKNGNYQIYVKKMNEDGMGTLFERYNRLLDLLRDKGYFDQSKKKQIPYLPKRIALVTSPTGAAVRDMISVMKRRFPGVKLLVCSVLVQGDSAPLDIALMIDLINKDNLADLIITGRGGGSIEELWAFNERVVAESIFNSSIPVISAVGHETDFTICDFVADMRAPTPSAAAELAVPDIEDVIFAIGRYKNVIIESLNQKMSMKKEKIKSILNIPFFSRPFEKIQTASMNIDYLNERLTEKVKISMDFYRHEISAKEVLLKSLSHENILKRGFCILKKDDNYVTGKDIRQEDNIEIITHSNRIYSEVINIEER